MFDKIISREHTNCIKYDSRKLKFGTSDLMPLWIADMDFESSDLIIESLKKRCKNKIFGYEKIPNEVTSNISNWLLKIHNFNVKENDIILTTGVINVINVCVNIFTKKNDNIIIQTPVYPPFFDFIKNNDRNIVENKLLYKNNKYSIDFKHLEEAMKNSSMFILCSPHNPTGNVWSHEELIKISNMAAKYNVIIVSDEIHSDIVYESYAHISMGKINQNAIILMSPNKIFNTASLCCAFAIVQNNQYKHELKKEFNKYQINSVNTFAINAMSSIYENGYSWRIELLKYLQLNRDFIIDYVLMNIPKLKVIVPEGTFLIWLNFEAFKIEKSLQEFLVYEAKLGLNAGETFSNDCKSYARLNFALSRPKLKIALERLKLALSNLD